MVHFISQGTIEEGMLALLGFKKSVFSGVLDGGPNEVFMGGTRLKKFMESVEKATGNIPTSMPEQSSTPADAEGSQEEPSDGDGAATTEVGRI